MSSYIPVAEAVRKLKFADEKSSAVYIYGATGYGKTRLVQEYLKGRNIVELSPFDEEWDFTSINAGAGDSEKICVVIDDMHRLQTETQKNILNNLIECKGIWLIMIGRMPTPHWLLPELAAGNLMIIAEEDLWLTEKEINELALSENVTLCQESLKTITSISSGNAYAVLTVIYQMKGGQTLTHELTAQIQKIFADHLEKNIISQWNADLQEFLEQMSVVEEFTLPLAVMITGNDQAAAMIEKAENSGNFLTKKDDTWRIRAHLLGPLQNRALKRLGVRRFRQCQNNAGLYFEMNHNYLMAIKLYEAAENTDNIKALLVRNARNHMGSGEYYMLRQYYLKLDEAEVETSPVLMAALSMLHSVMMDPEESEKWYEKLKEYAQNAQGGEKREANEKLLYLDIGLPHRGTVDLIDVLKRTITLLRTGGMTLPEFSVTNNQPSTMNGGKDFCSWSKRDEFIANTIGGMVEKILGSFGKGLVHAALCESFYEKGGRDEESMQHAVMVQMAADSGGKTELLFAAIGITIRRNIFSGNQLHAQTLLDSFEKRVKNENKQALIPNINALRCRMALVTGDMKTVDAWLNEAPDEQMEFWSLDRYRYMTKVLCYISLGQNADAIGLLDRLLYYAEINKRPYVRMESNLLKSIALWQEKREWKPTLMAALNEIQEYEFVRIISEKGAGILPLLKAIKKDYLEQESADKQWFSRVLKETGKTGERYPNYLVCDTAQIKDFSEKALQILRMQAQGLSIKEIAAAIEMSERTVKYHAAENYRKLGARGKTDAVQIARSLNML